MKDTFLPPLCPVCGKISPQFLCESCASDIKFLGFHVCIRCGKPLIYHDSTDEFDKTVSGSKICSLCKDEVYYFYRLRSFTEYNNVVSSIISKYKYRRYSYLADVLIDFLKTAYDSYYIGEEIDFLDTVPDNGFAEDYDKKIINKNHMQIIADKFSRITGIPFVNNMIKIRKTSKQQGLDRSQREINLKGAFKPLNCLKIRGKNFLIIDDVWTTGSTLNELSLSLKNSGANKIYLLTVARRL